MVWSPNQIVANFCRSSKGFDRFNFDLIDIFRLPLSYGSIGFEKVFRNLSRHVPNIQMGNFWLNQHLMDLNLKQWSKSSAKGAQNGLSSLSFVIFETFLTLLSSVNFHARWNYPLHHPLSLLLPFARLNSLLFDWLKLYYITISWSNQDRPTMKYVLHSQSAFH